jgi:hypothetical protein
MSYKAALRVWRCDDRQGQLTRPVEVNGGEVVPTCCTGYRPPGKRPGHRWNCKP